MNISLLILCVISITLLLALKLRYAHKKRVSQTKALDSLILLNSLIGHTQKHRGLNASFLQGKKQVLADIQDTSTTIANIEKELLKHKHIFDNDRWKSYQDHWSRLSKTMTSLNLKNSFEQHTAVIANLLYLIEDIAEYYELNESNFENFQNLSLLWRELPMTAEHIGQSRAIGVAIVASGNCNQVDKVKLGYLEKRIDTVVKSTFQHLQKNKQHCPKKQILIESVTQASQKLTNTIREELIAKQNIEISAEAYFSMASEAMDTINKFLKFELSNIQTYLNR